MFCPIHGQSNSESGICIGCCPNGTSYTLPIISSTITGLNGWECPKCHKIYSPSIEECKNCNDKIQKDKA